MKLIETPLEGLLVLKPDLHGDERGYFYESYNKQRLKDLGVTNQFVQDNQAYSKKGVLRGLHYQIGSMAQAKLVRVVHGKVLDVVVDIRPDSETYGQSFQILLSGINHTQLLVPRGFAHGYVVVSEDALFCYKCDNFYSPDHEGGIRYDDPTLDIAWGVQSDEIQVSTRDLSLPPFGEHRMFP